MDSTSSLVIRMAALTNNLIRVKIGHPPLLQSPNKTVVRQTDFNVFSKALIINSSEFAKTSSELISTSSELILTIAELISTITETI
ncbi:unknown [Prevotella sp. CAG:891]|nr:unknown [Prevotella sp. CAG:891]